jgi:hypothetical protein
MGKRMFLMYMFAAVIRGMNASGINTKPGVKLFQFAFGHAPKVRILSPVTSDMNPGSNAGNFGDHKTQCLVLRKRKCIYLTVLVSESVSG